MTEGSPGPSTDRHNEPVVDPTANVLLLVEAAVKRIDDIAELRAKQESHIADLRADYDQKLRIKEAERIDAIRAVDVSNVQRAADVVATQAETLRKQVTDTATAFAVSLSAALQPILKDIADLRQVQYETAGGKAQTVETREVTSGHISTTGLIVASVIGFIGLILTAVSIVVGIYFATH